MSEAIINPEVFSLASQLYVRMRRSGRVVDAVYMAQNSEYAREILRIAARESDMEIQDIISRFEALLARDADKTPPRAVEPAPAPVAEPVAEKHDIFSMTLRPRKPRPPTQPELPVVNAPSVAVHTEELEEEVAHHYIGSLR